MATMLDVSIRAGRLESDAVSRVLNGIWSGEREHPPTGL